MSAYSRIKSPTGKSSYVIFNAALDKFREQGGCPIVFRDAVKNGVSVKVLTHRAKPSVRRAFEMTAKYAATRVTCTTRKTGDNSYYSAPRYIFE